MTRPEAKLAVRGVGGAGGNGGNVGAFSRLARERLDRSRSSDGMSGIGIGMGMGIDIGSGSGNGRPLAGHPSTTCVVAGSSLRDWSFRADCGGDNAESDVAVAAALPASFSGYPHHDRPVLEVDSDDNDKDYNDKDDNDDALAAMRMGEASVGESSRKALLLSADGVETSSAATEPSSTVPSDLTPHFVHLRVASDGSGAVLRHCVADASADAGPWRAWERGRRGAATAAAAAAAAAAEGRWSDDDDHGSRGSRRRRHRHQQRQRKGLRFHATKIRLRATATSNAATATNTALPGQWRHVSNLAASLAPKVTASCAPPPAPAESSPHRHQPHQHQPTTDAKERHGRKWTSPDFLTSMPLWRNDSASDQTCARSRDGVGVGVDMDIQTNTNQDTKTPLRKNLRLVDLDESPPLYESPSSPVRVAVARVEHVARAASARKERERGNKRRRNGRRRNGAARGAGVAIVDLDNPPNDDNDDDDSDNDDDDDDNDDENYNESITTDNNNTHEEKEKKKKKEEKETDGDCSLSSTNRKKTVVAVVARAVNPRPTKPRRSPPRSTTLLGRKLTNSRGDKHVTNDIDSDNDDNKNDCDNDDDDDSDDDDNDGDVLVRNPFRDEALQSPSCTSPGTLRLTSDGLRRHERKTSLQSGETPLPPPPLSTHVQSSDMGVAGDSNFLIPIATMSPTEWKRRRDAQRMMLLSDREQLQQQQQQQQGFRLRGGDGANNASADVGACIAMTKLRSGEDKATTTITTTTTTTAAAAITSISPPLKPIPMPLDERSGTSTTTTDDAGSDDGGTLRKIRKGVKKQLEALVARAGSDASLSNMYAGRGDDASTSAQSRLSTMACAPDDFSPCGDGGGGGGGNGSGGGGGGGDKDESRNDDVAPLWKFDLNFPHRIKAATKKGIKKKTSDRSPKWFERQIIREEDAEEGFAQVSGSGLSAEWIGGCSQRQTAGQQEEMPRWMMLGMRTGETTAEAGVGVATFANEGVRAGANRRGARRPNLRDTWGKGDCILGSSTITFNSVGPNDSGVEVANCLGAKGGDCNVVGNRSDNDCDNDDDDDDDDGQKSCSVFSVATARADNRRAVRLPNSPAVPGLCMPTGSHPPALSLPSSSSLSSSTAAEKATEPTVPGRCAVCDEGPRTHVAVPCMHLSFCAECVSELRAGGEKSCPVCGEDDVTFSKVNF